MPYVCLVVVGGVRRDATQSAQRAITMLVPALALIGLLAAMLPGPVLTGDTAAIVAVTVPLLASLSVAALATAFLVHLLLSPAPQRSPAAPVRPGAVPHWLQHDLPRRPQQPRAPGRR